RGYRIGALAATAQPASSPRRGAPPASTRRGRSTGRSDEPPCLRVPAPGGLAALEVDPAQPAVDAVRPHPVAAAVEDLAARLGQDRPAPPEAADLLGGVCGGGQDDRLALGEEDER